MVFLDALRVVMPAKLCQPEKYGRKRRDAIQYNSTNQWPPAKATIRKLSTRLFRQMATVCNRKRENHRESIQIPAILTLRPRFSEAVPMVVFPKNWVTV